MVRRKHIHATVATVAVVLGGSAAWPATAVEPCGPVVLLPGRLPAGMVGAPYSQRLVAEGGEAPYDFSLIAGALPEGLTLAPDGTISGTPSRRAGWSFTVMATDAKGCEGSADLRIYVCWPMEVVPPALPGAVEGRPYAEKVTAYGSPSPTQLVVGEGELPPGLHLEWAGGPDSVLQGVPLLPGRWEFILQGVGDGCTFERAYVLEVQPAIAPIPALPAASR